MNSSKNIYALTQNYLLNGVYSYALFGVYALTVSPIVSNFFEFGEPNVFIAVFGFTMLVAEFIALKYKLNVIRVRTQLKRIEYKKQTGIDVIPSVTPRVLFGFFSRLVFHIGIIMVCMCSLGYVCTERNMSPQGVIAVMTGFFLEISGIIYLYLNYDFHTDIPLRKKAIQQELKEDDEWNAANLSNEIAAYSYRKEMVADIVLHIFSCMLFTSYWHFVNERGIETLLSLYRHHIGAFGSFMMLFPIMVSTIVIGLMPLQISHWIEVSLQAFSVKEKKKDWIIFLTVGIFICAPTIIKYLEIYVFQTGNPSSEAFPKYMEYLLSLTLFIVVLLIEIKMLTKKEETLTENPESIK